MSALLLADAMCLAFPGNAGIDRAAAELRLLHAQRDRLLNALIAVMPYLKETDSFAAQEAQVIAIIKEVAKGSV